MMTITFLTRALLSVGVLLLSCSAQAVINLNDVIPIGPQVKTGRLANGLSYFIHKNNRPEKHVELRLVVKVGSVMEDDDQQGLAHFTEHMAFNGSAHFKKHELVSYLQSIGVKFGADLNAYTSFDETVYILPIPTDKKENLETGFQVLEDWAQGVQMLDVDIDKERDIILEEARLGKGANDRMNKQLWPEVFNGSKYAERLPIGKESIIKHFTYDAIKRFYADWYRPNLMAVIVVGDIEPEQAEAMIQGHFSKLKNPVNERPRNYLELPARTDSKALVITDQEATFDTVWIRYQVHPAAPNKNIVDYRQSMIKNLATSMLAQRMQELTQQAKPPFLAASSSMGQVVRGYEAFTSFATIGRDGIAPAIEAVVQENERARQFGFSEDELERVKKMQLRGFENMYGERDKSNSANFAAEYIRHFLVQESIPGLVNEYAYGTLFLPGISLSEVNQYARDTIPTGTQKLVVYMGSSKAGAPIPLPATLLTLVNKAESAPVIATKQKPIAASLMERPNKAGSIVSERWNQALGLHEMTLSNGVKLILKPTDFKNDQVLMSAMRFGGSSLYEDKDQYSAIYTNAIAWSMGLKTFPPTDIPKILAGKSASMQTSNDYYSESIGGSAGSDDVESLFQLLYLRMTSPRKDQDLFAAFIKRAQDATKNSMASPELIFNDSIITTLFNHHPRLGRSAKQGDFDKIDLDRSLAIFADRYGSAKDLTFIIVGSFSMEKIKPLIELYLANLPTPDILTGYRDLGIRPVKGVVKKEVRVGSEAKSTVSINFTGAANYSLMENTRFHLMIAALNLRITDILREKLTLIYSGGISGSINRDPYQHYHINLALPCASENVDKVIAAMFVEIEKIKAEGVLPADLNKVKQNWLKERRIDLRTNSFWLNDLQDSVLYGTDMSRILSYEKRINEVTSEDVKQAAGRYLSTDNYVQAVMYPEK